jgi:hypothetical protein
VASFRTTEISCWEASKLKRIINLIFALILLSGFGLLIGCLESNFQLSDDSRLPVWIKLPPTVKRQDVSLTLNYYSNPFGPNAKFILRNRHGDILQEVSGNDKPIGNTLSELKYPSYVLVVVNGVPEIIEHRTMGPIFYISDDPDMKSKILH